MGIYLQQELIGGNWGVVKRLRQGIRKQHLKMKDMFSLNPFKTCKWTRKVLLKTF